MNKIEKKFKIFNYVLIASVAIAILTTVWYFVAETFPFGMEVTVNEAYGPLTVKILLAIFTAMVITELVFGFLGYKDKRFAKWSGTVGFLSFIMLAAILLVCPIGIKLSIIIFVILGFTILYHSSFSTGYARLPDVKKEEVKAEEKVEAEPEHEDMAEPVADIEETHEEQAVVKPKPANKQNEYKKQYPMTKKRKK